MGRGQPSARHGAGYRADARICRKPADVRRDATEFHSVAFTLAELDMEVELLRSIVYRATEAYVAGEDVTRLATMAKLKLGRWARQVADPCLQYWGGMGYMWDSPVSRAYRDFRLSAIAGGADEVMLQILARMAAKTA